MHYTKEKIPFLFIIASVSLIRKWDIMWIQFSLLYGHLKAFVDNLSDIVDTYTVTSSSYDYWFPWLCIKLLISSSVFTGLFFYGEVTFCHEKHVKYLTPCHFFGQRSEFNGMDYFRAWSIFLQWVCSCQNLYSNRKLLTFLSLGMTTAQKDDWAHGKCFLKLLMTLSLPHLQGEKKIQN